MSDFRLGLASADGLPAEPARDAVLVPVQPVNATTQRPFVDGVGPACVIVTGTGPNAAPAGTRFQWLYCHVDAVLSGGAGDALKGGSVAGLTLKAGAWWRAPALSTFTLSSGVVTAYLA